MKSLRDEIYNLLDQSARIDSGYYTEEIIKLIEKRIDDKIEETELILGTTGLSDSIKIHYMSGYKKGLATVKEILK
jgi:hypothetical protein